MFIFVYGHLLLDFLIGVIFFFSAKSSYNPNFVIIAFFIMGLRVISFLICYFLLLKKTKTVFINLSFFELLSLFISYYFLFYYMLFFKKKKFSIKNLDYFHSSLYIMSSIILPWIFFIDFYKFYFEKPKRQAASF
jgi:hypothetical protein